VKNFLAFLCFFSAISIPSFADGTFPTSPDLALTPGSLCDRPNQKRYPEGVPYCSRDVKSELKKEIMHEYDAKLGYHVTEMQRSAFKIDHYIPLCMGGSNNQDNLWPQHVSVYTITDPLEPAFCGKMAAGKLRQAQAVELLKRAKHNLTEVPAILKLVESL
jgi:hypothetical protein